MIKGVKLVWEVGGNGGGQEEGRREEGSLESKRHMFRWLVGRLSIMAKK